MTLPNISTINNVYVNGVLNPQWNANGGIFGLLIPEGFEISSYGGNAYGQNMYGGVLPPDSIPFVNATATPSFVGASSYNAVNSSFSAKIVPAPLGNGSIQTSLVIKANEHNFIEMFYGPTGQFGGYVTNNSVPTPTTSPFPTYDPVTHSFWRIRNDGALFYFDVSPDGTTWTNLASLPYGWDASKVTVMFFAGFTGSETFNQKAFISSVNQSSTLATLSATGRDTSAVTGAITVTSANPLSGTASGFSGHNSHFPLSIGIPQGGVTDFSIASVPNGDAAQQRITNASLPAFSGGTNFTWTRSYMTRVAPTVYRDGSYWPPANSGFVIAGATSVPDNNPNLLTSVQFEHAVNSYNRLSPNEAFYTDTCEYVAQQSTTSTGIGGSTSVVRSPIVAYSGNYSGQMIYSGTPAIDGAGHDAYWPYPTRKAIIPVINNGIGQETLRGSVALYTTRANTQWYASIVLYDVNFNILSQTTFKQATVTNMNTHPGGGTWQIGTVLMPTAIGAVWAAVVPVVLTPPSGSETVYMSAHRLEGINPFVANVPSAYQDPKQFSITVKADRVNYAMNAGFNVDKTGWDQSGSGISGSPSPLTVSWDGTIGFNSLGSLKAAFATPSGTFTGTANAFFGPASYLVNFSSTQYPIVQRLKTGHTYNFSAWILQGPGCPDVSMNILDANYNGLMGISLNNIKNTKPSETVNGWTRIQTNFTVPPGGTSDYRIWFTVKYPDYVSMAPFNFWVDSITVEEALTAGNFFDGNFASADYQYELNGNQNNRTHYYKDFSNKLVRLNSVVPKFAPLGSSYTVLSAQPPT